MSKDVINMSFPARADYIIAARLAVSAIAERKGFSIDDIEDIKLACSVGYAILIYYRPVSVNICVTADDYCLDTDITAIKPVKREQILENRISMCFLEALMDKCSFTMRGKTITGVRLTKEKAGVYKNGDAYEEDMFANEMHC